MHAQSHVIGRQNAAETEIDTTAAEAEKSWARRSVLTGRVG
jgi:hypothetical protein